MQAMQEVHRIVSQRHDVARAWKAGSGGKVIGYFNIDIPEELIYAAGILPVRILGSHEPEVVTDNYMWNAMHRVYDRDCLAQGLQGRYAYLDGIMNVEGDPHETQCFLSWVRHIPIEWKYRFYVPGAYGLARAQVYLRNEVEGFKKSLETWTGKPISDAAIDQGIEVLNKTRRLVRQISALRKAERPRLSGAEFMEIALAGMLSDKASYNALLEKLLRELSERPEPDASGVRVMLSGGPNDHVDLIKSIESMGVRVVVDEHNTGGRYYETEVVPEADRCNAIAARIINKPRSALKDVPLRTRPKNLVELAQEYKAQGVIFMFQLHDDAEQFDYPRNKAALEECGIPTLLLELDFTNPLEQFRTRIEAFVEMLQARVA